MEQESERMIYPLELPSAEFKDGFISGQTVIIADAVANIIDAAGQDMNKAIDVLITRLYMVCMRAEPEHHEDEERYSYIMDFIREYKKKWEAKE